MPLQCEMRHIAAERRQGCAEQVARNEKSQKALANSERPVCDRGQDFSTVERQQLARRDLVQLQGEHCVIGTSRLNNISGIRKAQLRLIVAIKADFAGG